MMRIRPDTAAVHPSGLIDVNVEIGPSLDVDADASVTEARGLSAELGIDRMLVRHRAARTISRPVGNRLAMAVAEADPRFIPVATATPVALDRLAGELAELVKAGARAVWVDGADIWRTGSEAADELLTIAAGAGVPMLIPDGAFGDASAIGRLTQPLGVPVVLVGVHYMRYADVYAALRRFPHLRVETSSIASYMGVDEFVRRVGPNRVLFGSGMPVRSPRSPINAIAASRIRDDDKRMVLAGNAAVLFGLASSPVSLPQALFADRAFDVHGHFFPAPWEVPQPDDAEILPEISRHGIKIRVASAVPALLGDLERGNAQTVAACARTAGQLGYLVADPNEFEASRSAIRRWGSAPGIVGTKVHCVMSRQRTGSRAVGALFQVLADYGRPVKIHVDGEDWTTALADLAARHPDLPIIVAHGGPGRPLRVLADVLRLHENVYFELASSVAELSDVRDLVEAVGVSRLLFGTDAPLLDPAFILGTYWSLGLSDRDLAAVLWDNAALLFGLRG